MFATYSFAEEADLSDDGHTKLTHFLCDGGVHVTLVMTWRRQDTYPLRKEEWGTPTRCDGRCKIWFAQQLDMPKATRDACALVADTQDPALLPVTNFFTEQRFKGLGANTRLCNAALNASRTLAYWGRDSPSTVEVFIGNYPTSADMRRAVAKAEGKNVGKKTIQLLVDAIRAAGLKYPPAV